VVAVQAALAAVQALAAKAAVELFSSSLSSAAAVVAGLAASSKKNLCNTETNFKRLFSRRFTAESLQSCKSKKKLRFPQLFLILKESSPNFPLK
jgi:type III secretory pathway component EscU